MIQQATTTAVRDSTSQTVIFELFSTAIASSAIDLTSWIGGGGFDQTCMPIRCHIKSVILHLRLTLRNTYCILLYKTLTNELSTTAVIPSGQ